MELKWNSCVIKLLCDDNKRKENASTELHKFAALEPEEHISRRWWR